MIAKSISKVVSSNDIGHTGAHQAGILVPKNKEILSFFPALEKTLKNPRHMLVFHDESNERWEFSFIYYNNKFFGGTRNEYRLTRMTKYFNANNLKVGDELVLSKSEEGAYRVSIKRNLVQPNGKLKLSSEWKIISLK